MRAGLRFFRLVPLSAVLLACSDTSGPSDNGPPDGLITISGTIDNRTEATIPENTRLLLVWGVSATSPDYTYVFGEGTIDRNNGTFELVLEEPPPSAALNADALGVGVIAATTNTTVSTGDDIEIVPPSEIVGATGCCGVIYVKDSNVATTVRPWAEAFAPGYTVGVGEDVPGSSYDKFVPADASDVVLIIDEVTNIELVNWS
ncbi:MAG: hypothetical protein GEU90_02790 [Gemmatimonas sp.]|nr:hypothetical protein [Gemmatimonas sp.]